ncbi:MAG: amidase [Xanthomonadales bacterium]|nr:amidase [Xanthomonadales bacterium]NIX13181.1 amidase [Xanthomonadales bacterium]
MPARIPVFTTLLACLALSGDVEASGPEQRFAELALACIHQEYPNKIAHVMSGDFDVGAPRHLTPVFYGCFDWHSSVHGHWLLVRLLRLHPDAQFAADAEAALDESFQAGRVAIELAYMSHSQRTSFERPYGVAWFLQLMAELREWDDPRAARWRETLEPLETAYVAKMSDWLGKLAYPIRIGEHAQTAFAFALFIDWARAADDQAFLDLVTGRARAFHGDDADCPLAYEPGGQDFLSPCLAEADLMRRVFGEDEYAAWLKRFLPGIPHVPSGRWLPLARITDRSDGKLAHLDGLHLARAWALEGMAAALPDGDPREPAITAAAWEQGVAGLAAVTGEHYEGGHWLGSFATYLVTGRGTGSRPGWAAGEPVDPYGEAPWRTMLSRMAQREGDLNAMISIATPGQDTAAESSANRNGPLHGLPVILKDNIETRDLPTTAGSLALRNNVTGRDAELTRRLREAGLVVAGKANLSEWANFRDEKSTSGWSGVGGLTANAWDASRTACGSSSGSAVVVAAGYVPFAVGTETNGSIVCPASYNGVVGIKPTVGLVSRRGIVPIAHSQDTAGPMAYSVKAAALLLSAMEGEDPADPATQAAHDHFGRDYVSGLSADGLQGLRIGVIRSRDFGDGSERAFDQAVRDLATSGADLVDDLEFPEWPEDFWDQAYAVLLYEFKHDLNAYLASLPGPESRLTLEKLIAFNDAHADEEMPWFGQSIFVDAQEKGGLDEPEYLEALESVQTFTRSTLDGLLAEHGIDLLVMPTNAVPFSIDLVHGDSWHGGSSSFAAIAGYPHVTVPAGRVKGLPVGLSFVGTAFSEPVLIRAAHAYEQATGHATTLEGDDPWNLQSRFSENSGNQDSPLAGIIGKTIPIPGMVGEGARCEVAEGEQGEGQACE